MVTNTTTTTNTTTNNCKREDSVLLLLCCFDARSCPCAEHSFTLLTMVGSASSSESDAPERNEATSFIIYL
jgi:hypothetical protein